MYREVEREKELIDSLEDSPDLWKRRRAYLPGLFLQLHGEI